MQKFDTIGVGVSLMPMNVISNDLRLVVVSLPLNGSAAQAAGLKVGDYITAVNGVM